MFLTTAVNQSLHCYTVSVTVSVSFIVSVIVFITVTVSVSDAKLHKMSCVKWIQLVKSGDELWNVDKSCEKF